MRIFISSVSKGLRSLRKEVTNLLKTNGHSPDPQEEFGVDARRLNDLLRDRISKCDAVICLIGPYFGYKPPDEWHDPPRSYTQYEYFVARELQKDVLLFFASSDCELDSVSPDEVESEPDLQNQRLFRREIESTDLRIRYQFQSRDQLARYVLEACGRLKQGFSAPRVTRDVERFQPTPLAEMYAQWIDSTDSRKLFALTHQLVRFVSLMAVQDAASSGDVIPEGEASRALLTQEEFVDEQGWPDLLRAVCDPAACSSEGRFLPELLGWPERYRSAMKRALEGCQRIAKLRFEDLKLEKERHDVADAVTELFDGLAFLERYVLLNVSARTNHSAEPRPPWEVLRGLHPQTVDLLENCFDGTASPPAGLFLLDIERRRSLPLFPMFSSEWRCHNRGVYGWSMLQDADAASGRLVLTAFGNFEPNDVSRTVRWNDDFAKLEVLAGKAGESAEVLPGWWLRSNPVGRKLSASLPQEVRPEPSLILGDDAWQKLEILAFPERDPRRFVGGRFLLAPPLLHAGKHADLTPGLPAVAELDGPQQDGPETTAPVVVHVLRTEGLDDVVRAWFSRRHDLWNKLRHPQILPLDPLSQADPATESPFLATPRITGLNLEQLLIRQQRLSDVDTLRVLRLAAEVCQLAHSHNLRMLSLPLRHFLFDEGGHLWLTGFETLVPADLTTWDASGGFTEYLQRFSKDCELIAPEVFYQRRRLAPTVDVYALGQLVAKLKHMEEVPRLELPQESWDDPWKCLTFHCRATQPQLRFQSPQHLLAFLDERAHLHDERQWIPQCVAGLDLANPSGASGKALHYGKYPVTNGEFLKYCQERPGAWWPIHLQIHEENSFEDANRPYRRLAGPWTPVVYVHLDDASAYCHWLSERTGRKWRIPCESEWIAAAGPQEYPWGDAAPNRDLANYESLYRGPTVVGAFPSGNSVVGCADMAGNVWEWCVDRVHDGVPRRVLKGGAYDVEAEALCSSHQSQALVWCRSPNLGFRVLCEERNWSI
ncbi:MAG: SUMF1/EgtB/PvdO family nonheme iron enzyme [Planctomycetota bacterium]